MTGRYNSLKMKSPIEFGQIFSDSVKVDYKKVLCQYSREMVIRLAVLLNREYCNEPAGKICQMLSSNDPKQTELARRIGFFLQKNSNPNIEYVVGLETMTLELLRLAFSIPYEYFNNSNYPVNVNEVQFQTIKLITQINERSMEYKIDEIHMEDLAVLLYTNSASSFDILHYNKQNEFIAQVVQATLFFKLLDSDPKCDVLLKEFYNEFSISNWHEYLRTLVALFCISNEHEGSIAANLAIDVESLMTPSVLERLSIPLTHPLIAYSSKDEFDQNGNSDYRVFRNRPLFKAANGDYLVHSRPLLTDRIYSGLYFDFMKIAERLSAKHPDIGNLFTSEFVEKTLFVGLMKSCITSCNIESFDEEELKTIHKIKDGELGYPDYFIKSKEAVILFECKDIRLNAWIKDQRDFPSIESELRNKLVSKTYQLDFKNHSRKNITPKRIGCGQIAGHLANIRKSSFPWDPTLSQRVKVYPVLVIADNRLLAQGLPTILQRWFKECLNNEGLSAANEYPLILMSPLTLIKYSDRFAKDGFPKYFDDYYRSISVFPNDVVSAFNNHISFDDYMSQYQFNLEELGKQFIQELMADRNNAQY